MTRDDIIRMAREWLPKAYRDGDVGDEPKFTKHNMEVAFAAGAAAERERLAAKFMEMHNAQQHRNNYFAFAARVIREEA